MIEVEQDEIESALSESLALLGEALEEGRSFWAESLSSVSRKLAFVLPNDHPLRQKALALLDQDQPDPQALKMLMFSFVRDQAQTALRGL